MSRVHVVYHLTISKNFDDIDAVVSKLRSNEFINITKPLLNCLVFEKNIDTIEVSNFFDHAKNILASVYGTKLSRPASFLISAVAASPRCAAGFPLASPVCRQAGSRGVNLNSDFNLWPIKI
jgi:hypothetical protein